MVVFNYYIVMIVVVVYLCVVFNDTATTEIYTYGHTLSLHDALPISVAALGREIRRVLEPGAEGGCQRSRAVHVHDARQSVRLARARNGSDAVGSDGTRARRHQGQQADRTALGVAEPAVARGPCRCRVHGDESCERHSCAEGQHRSP